MFILLKGSNGSVASPNGQADFIEFPLNLQVAMTVAYVTIFVISLVGNVVMVYVIFKTPDLRTTTNLLIANMAIADLIITFFAMPYCVTYLYLQNIWISGIFGDIACRIVQYVLALAISGSVLTHVLVALERFFCLVFPFKRVAFIKNSKLCYSFIWCSSFILMSPYLAVYGSQQLGPGGNSYCAVKLEYLKILQVYFPLIFLFLYLLPLAFIATLYTFVCRKLWKHKSPGILSQTAIEKRESRKRKTVKMLIILVIVFALCWLPAHVMHMYSYLWYNTTLPLAVPLLSFWACHSHSAINPLLVASFNQLYRKACRDMVRKFRTSVQSKRNDPQVFADVKMAPFGRWNHTLDPQHG